MDYSDYRAINISAVRQAVEDYYGSAMYNSSPVAATDMERILHMSDIEIYNEAQKLGIAYGGV